MYRLSYICETYNNLKKRLENLLNLFMTGFSKDKIQVDYTRLFLLPSPMVLVIPVMQETIDVQNVEEGACRNSQLKETEIFFIIGYLTLIKF